ncbi:hypothetical protein [Spiroplasma endosymbiont of Virgichneumon dumeticola]|uniref:hypothetical protein n=1 Tax=Spiroplasma endosymbiont of Virgichneumon dumeticola TaxID=3139323 RepID=UPI0035C8FC08
MKSMASMKTLLRLLGAGVLTTVAATSVVACGPNNPGTAMEAKVSENFGFTDNKGVSTVETKVVVTTDVASWSSTQLTGITADKLLTTGGNTADKAVSVGAGDFLVNVFKLTVVAGTGADRTFNHADATPIIMSVKTWSPTIAKKGTDDYAVNGGTTVVQFKKGTDQLGVDYTLNILAKPNDGIIQSLLPATAGITLSNFNTIANFAAGKPKTGITVGQDLVSNFKVDATPGKGIKSIVDLIKQGALAVKVTEVNAAETNFANSDTLKVKISIGTITFATEYTLTLV